MCVATSLIVLVGKYIVLPTGSMLLVYKSLSVFRRS